MDIDSILDIISTMIRDNLSLLLLDDDALINLKEYCKHGYKKDKYRLPNSISYDKLVYFTEEAIADLINMNFWYDYRDLE